jgi:hypothetical protein
MLTLSFENCADCKPRIALIKTAEGGMVIEITHALACMKTYHVQTRTGEILLITTKASAEILKHNSQNSLCNSTWKNIFSTKKLRIIENHRNENLEINSPVVIIGTQYMRMNNLF